MYSKNIFFTLGFWVGLPQNLGFDFTVFLIDTPPWLLQTIATGKEDVRAGETKVIRLWARALLDIITARFQHMSVCCQAVRKFLCRT